MIIKGEPEKGLQKHQQEAYKAIIKAYKESDKAAIVMPTGAGKSFVAMQLMEDNKEKRILFMAPSVDIKNQMYNYIAKYIIGEEPTKEKSVRKIVREHFPNFKIITYQALLRIKKEQMEEKADIIIMDELHRTGADKWGKKVNTLLELNPEAKVLGMTATPDRMDDKNVVDDLFEGNINYELTLIEALRDRILKSPIYVKCDYYFGEQLKGIKERINDCTEETQKAELMNIYEKMRKIVEQADKIPELLEKNIKKKDGRYIIFCRNKEDMDKIMPELKEWFKYIDEEPEIYSVYTGYGKKKNEEEIKKFEKSKSEHIKLMCSIDKFNEGVHVEDIAGVIMARPTESEIIYLQQLGRALSSDEKKDKPIVIDLVNNYLNFLYLDKKLNDRTKESKRKRGKSKQSNKDESDIEGEKEIKDDSFEINIFKIQGEALELLELLNQEEKLQLRVDWLKRAKEIKNWIEKSGDTKPPSQTSKDEKERKLGIQLRSIRRYLIKPYLEMKTEEEREQYRKKHPEIDELIEIINEIDKNNVPLKLKQARKIKNWIEKSEDTKMPSAHSKDEEERKLGKQLTRIRQSIKPYLEIKTEEERKQYRKKHPEIDEVMKIINEIDKNNVPIYLKNAREIKKWIEKSGDTKMPSASSKDEEERKLGKQLKNIRSYLIKPYIEMETEEEREQYRKKHPEIDKVIEIINEIDKNNVPVKLKQAREIKRWIEKSEDTKPPSQTSKDEEERKLGTQLNSIRSYLIKPYIEIETEEEREQYRKERPEIDEVIEIINEIDKNNVPLKLKQARKIKNWIEKSEDTKIPSTYSKDEEERKLGIQLKNIKSYLIKPYIKIETEEEREQYRKKHPEIDEVMEIIYGIYQCIEYKTMGQEEFINLMKQTFEKEKSRHGLSEFEEVAAKRTISEVKSVINETNETAETEKEKNTDQK